MYNMVPKRKEKKGTGYLVEKLCLEQPLFSKQMKTNNHDELCGDPSPLDLFPDEAARETDFDSKVHPDSVGHAIKKSSFALYTNMWQT
jgi:hypothetical protein